MMWKKGFIAFVPKDTLLLIGRILLGALINNVLVWKKDKMRLM
jgi:hypothetical protein